MTTLSENWNVADHATSMNGQLSWTQLAGVWGISSSRAEAKTTSTWHSAVPTTALAGIDHDVTVDTMSGTGGGGGAAIARSLNGAATHYMATMNMPWQLLELRRSVNNSRTTLASVGFTITANTWYTLRLVVTGTNPVSLEMLVGGVSRLTHSDSDAARLTAGSYAGVAAFRNSTVPTYVDTWTAQDIVSGTTHERTITRLLSTHTG